MNAESQSPAVLNVHTADGRSFRFSTSFQVGRGSDCAVRIQDVHVSSRHLEVAVDDNGYWELRDLQSLNGVFVDGRRVQALAIEDNLTIRLGGTDGPALTLEVEAPATTTHATSSPTHMAPPAAETAMLDEYADRYFRSTGDEQVGDRTLMIRQAFQKIQKKQQRKYQWILAVVALAAAVAGAYAYYGYRQMSRQMVIAEEIFYSMKALDVDVANLEQRVASSGDTQSDEQVRSYRDRRRELERDYERFLAVLNPYKRKLTPEEQLILRVTRIFGECELAAPPEYLSEVTRYIRRWQTTGRYIKAVKLAQDRGYVKTIFNEFVRQNLPPQFFYLALEESDFNPYASGPPTRVGFAKGMWQFIPETAKTYGLRIGPLYRLPTPDGLDDRHNWQKSTVAAARYIKTIYSTDAQASGLLVMASYNWGEHRVIDLLQRMPRNPRDRNFWKVLEKYRREIPPDTYNYVFDIVSAAVIGENPRLFGFPFDNPLEKQ
jgi:membrane-bound lytic murein transglycosylase D